MFPLKKNEALPQKAQRGPGTPYLQRLIGGATDSAANRPSTSYRHEGLKSLLQTGRDKLGRVSGGGAKEGLDRFTYVPLLQDVLPLL